MEFNYRVPGRTDGPDFIDKQICVHADHHIRDRIAVTIAPNSGDLDKGTVLGFSTADNLARPVRRSALTAAAATGAKKVTVSDATKFKVGDTVAVIKADGTGLQNVGAVSSVTGNDVSFPTATTADLALNDFLFVKDGSETALVILGDVAMNASANQICNAYVAGKFYLTQLVGVDSFVSKDLKARIVPFGQNNGQAESIYIV